MLGNLKRDSMLIDIFLILAIVPLKDNLFHSFILPIKQLKSNIFIWRIIW